MAASFAQNTQATIYESNTQIAQLVDNIGATELGDAAALHYRQTIDAVLHTAAQQLTGDATRGVALSQSQVNAALQLLQQVRYKLYDAIALGAKEKKK